VQPAEVSLQESACLYKIHINFTKKILGFLFISLQKTEMLYIKREKKKIFSKHTI
jgi:hypothetical protein